MSLTRGRPYRKSRHDSGVYECQQQWCSVKRRKRVACVCACGGGGTLASPLTLFNRQSGGDYLTYIIITLERLKNKSTVHSLFLRIVFVKSIQGAGTRTVFVWTNTDSDLLSSIKDQPAGSMLILIWRRSGDILSSDIWIPWCVPQSCTVVQKHITELTFDILLP